jgi:hypothetical protein
VLYYGIVDFWRSHIIWPCFSYFFHFSIGIYTSEAKSLVGGFNSLSVEVYSMLRESWVSRVEVWFHTTKLEE